MLYADPTSLNVTPVLSISVCASLSRIVGEAEPVPIDGATSLPLGFDNVTVTVSLGSSSTSSVSVSVRSEERRVGTEGTVRRARLPDRYEATTSQDERVETGCVPSAFPLLFS